MAPLTISKPVLLAAVCFLANGTRLSAGTVVIDDFSFSQATAADAGRGGPTLEISDTSIFGGYRRIGATGYAPFTLDADGQPVPTGDTSGISSAGVSGGLASLSKTAVSGSAFLAYQGRPFTEGDRIGDLSLDIFGGPGSLASPVLFLGHTSNAFTQTISLFLSSAVGEMSIYDILLVAGTTQTIVDLPASPHFGEVDFSNIEDILISLRGGAPAGSVQLNTIAFIPEPAPLTLAGISAILIFLRRGTRSGR